MKQNRLHIISRGNKWAIKMEGNSKAYKIVDKLKIIVHKRNGVVDKIIMVESKEL